MGFTGNGGSHDPFKENDVMDVKTLKELLKEAKKNAKSYTKSFEKYDNSEDMHAMERWNAMVTWLEWHIDHMEKK